MNEVECVLDVIRSRLGIMLFDNTDLLMSEIYFHKKLVAVDNTRALMIERYYHDH